MDGTIARLADIRVNGLPGVAFGEAPATPRLRDPGMGLAVGRRTVFRPEDLECFGRVADRVATGNMALLRRDDPATRTEQARLRNAIATGALLTLLHSGLWTAACFQTRRSAINSRFRSQVGLETQPMSGVINKASPAMLEAAEYQPPSRVLVRKVMIMTSSLA